MAGWRKQPRDSISAPAIFSPPRLISSLRRPCRGKEAVFVEAADIARAKPALLLESSAIEFGRVEIARHHGGPTNPDLTPLASWIRDVHPHQQWPRYQAKVARKSLA